MHLRRDRACPVRPRDFCEAVLAAIIWGVLLAPASNRRLADPLRLLAEIVIFAVGALALAAAGQPTFAVIFAVVALVNMILLRIWQQ